MTNDFKLDPENSYFYLSLNDKNNYNLYYEYWNNSNYKRPHDHPGFLEVMRPKNYKSEVVIFQYTNKLKIVYPFYRIELNDLPAFNSIEKPLSHIVSPYGYGAPLYEGNDDLREIASRKFEDLFHQELSKRGVISEFVREDLFTNRLSRRTVGTVVDQQPNVVVRLNRSIENIWKSYKAKVRKNVKHAMRSNLKIIFDPSGEYLDDFMEIYHGTMKRKNALKSFFITKEKFKTLLKKLGKNNALMFVHVLDKMDIVSTELLLLSTDTIYSFLGGTLTSSYNKRPNDLLKHEIISWGNENGYEWFVLGGGVTSGDGIYKYKEAFDPFSIFPFYVRKIIHNNDAYEWLIQMRQRYETACGHNWQPRADFFPKYLS